MYITSVCQPLCHYDLCHSCLSSLSPLSCPDHPLLLTRPTSPCAVLSLSGLVCCLSCECGALLSLLLSLCVHVLGIPEEEQLPLFLAYFSFALSTLPGVHDNVRDTMSPLLYTHVHHNPLEPIGSVLRQDFFGRVKYRPCLSKRCRMIPTRSFSPDSAPIGDTVSSIALTSPSIVAYFIFLLILPCPLY